MLPHFFVIDTFPSISASLKLPCHLSSSIFVVHVIYSTIFEGEKKNPNFCYQEAKPFRALLPEYSCLTHFCWQKQRTDFSPFLHLLEEQIITIETQNREADQRTP